MRSFIISGLLVLLFAPVSLFASTLEGRETYSLPADARVTEDLYAAGGTAVFSGEGTQDVALFGGKIVVPGSVGGDLLILGGDINMLGSVADDMRVVGGSVFVTGAVGGDLVVVGGSVQLLDGATVSGDLVVFGGDVTIEGTVRGDVDLYAGRVRITGETGKVTAHADDIALTGATVHGTFAYTSANEASIDEASSIEGEVVRTQAPDRRRELAGAAAFLGGAFFIGKVIALLVATVALFYLFRGFSVRLGTDAVETFGRSVFVGLASLVVMPIVSVLLLLTLLGAYLGLAGLLGYVLLLIVAELFSGIVAGAVLSRVFVREVRMTLPWILGGVIFTEFVFLVPFIGWAIALIIYLMAFGTLARILFGAWQERDES